MVKHRNENQYRNAQLLNIVIILAQCSVIQIIRHAFLVS